MLNTTRHDGIEINTGRPFRNIKGNYSQTTGDTKYFSAIKSAESLCRTVTGSLIEGEDDDDDGRVRVKEEDHRNTTEVK